MSGVWGKNPVDPEITSRGIGSCFAEALNNVSGCAEQSKLSYEKAMAGVEPPTETEIAEFKKAMKAQR